MAEVRFGVQNFRELNGQKIRRQAGGQVVQTRMMYSDVGGHVAGGCMMVNRRARPDSVFQGAARHRGGFQGSRLGTGLASEHGGQGDQGL